MSLKKPTMPQETKKHLWEIICAVIAGVIVAVIVAVVGINRWNPAPNPSVSIGISPNTPSPSLSPSLSPSPSLLPTVSPTQPLTPSSPATSSSLAISPDYMNKLMQVDNKIEKTYRITLNKDEGITIVAFPQNVKLTLLSLSGNILRQNSLTSQLLDFDDIYCYIDYKATESTTVYVDIPTNVTKLGFYDAFFNSNFTDSERDFFSSPFTSKLIENGTYNIDDGITQWYRIYIKENQIFSATFTPQLNAGHMYMNLHDDNEDDGNNNMRQFNGSILDGTGYIKSGKTGTVKLQAKFSGWYFIDVSGNKGKYSLLYSLT